MSVPNMLKKKQTPPDTFISPHYLILSNFLAVLLAEFFWGGGGVSKYASL